MFLYVSFFFNIGFILFLPRITSIVASIAIEDSEKHLSDKLRFKVPMYYQYVDHNILWLHMMKYNELLFLFITHIISEYSTHLKYEK